MLAGAVPQRQRRRRQRALDAAARRLASSARGFRPLGEHAQGEPSPLRPAICRDAAARPALGARRRAGGLDGDPPARARPGLAARAAARVHAVGGGARAAGRDRRAPCCGGGCSRSSCAACAARARGGDRAAGDPEPGAGGRPRRAAARAGRQRGRRPRRRRAERPCARCAASASTSSAVARAPARGRRAPTSRRASATLLPHQVLRPRPGFSGTGLYSRIPLRAAPGPAGTRFAISAASAAPAGAAPLELYAVHVRAPTSPAPTRRAGATTCARCRRRARAGCGSWPATSTPRSTTTSCGACSAAATTTPPSRPGAACA